MPMSSARWKYITESQYPWEREALEFIRQRLPDHEPYRAWANFEFVADSGSICEVDLLVLSPKGFFLVEIKSRPGTLEGDSHTWTWTQDGRKYSYDNPLILADRKAKRLKSLLARQKAAQKVRVPFLQPVVFCSAEDLSLRLEVAARHQIYLRDRDRTGNEPEKPGIVAALTRWTPGAPDDPGDRRVDRPIAKALSRAIGEAGIRPSQRSRRVSDYVLGELIAEGPAYQDWAAEHCSAKGIRARVRLYPMARGLSEETRQTLQRAAEREFRILQGIDHSGILRPVAFTVHERGPALIFDYDPRAVRLDHFLLHRVEGLGIDLRLGILRQVAEALRHAHGKKLIHRALSPQCVLVSDADSPFPRIQVFDWQTGTREPGSTSATPGVTGTVHPKQLVEDASLVYMAPEVVSGNDGTGECADVFSLGTLAFHVFSGRPPAPSLLQRDDLLRSGRGLDLSAAVDGVGKALHDLVYLSTAPEVSERLDSVADFLELLEQVEEELTAPDEEPIRDPTEAKIGDQLPGGFVVKKRLGRGSCAVTFLVERDGSESVLKIAATPEHNDRLRDEAEVLEKLRHERIVEFRRLLDVGDRVGILMADAGDKTLGQRIRADGRLHVDLLERFGEELLQAVSSLEEQGIAHRDIKPDNIGVTPGVSKDRLHIVLFDFSLSRTPADNIRAGTRPYLDPFLALRRPPRWDLHAERFAAAMTLYEMATGVLPKWGDGQSDPAVIEAEATLDTELLDADLREAMSEFFRQALRRDYAERFDTCEQMLRAWRHVFETGERREARDDEATADVAQALENATLDTQVALLPLSTRVLSAMERLGIVTVGELLQVPVMRIYGMRGVGNKTRREIRELVLGLSQRLSGDEVPAVSGVRESEAAEEYAAERASVDILVNRILPTRGRINASEEKTIRLLVGLHELPKPAPMGWPSQTDVAGVLSLTRARIGQFVSRARQRWLKNPLLTGLREDLSSTLDKSGGVMTAVELSAAVLASRGSVQRDPQRARAALAVTRAAIEAERQRGEPRFIVRRSGACVFIAKEFDLTDYAERLAKVADELASEDPLPSPRRVQEALEAVRAPAGAVFEPARLVKLAAAASNSAAVSSRLEIYPRGMGAGRAVKLAHGAFLGAGELTVDDLRGRVRSRYPEAEGLPGRPALDNLIKDAGWDLVWESGAAQGRGAYRPRHSVVGRVTSGSSSITRYPSETPPAEVTPEVADARRFEERLQHAICHGAFLALTVRPRDLQLADKVLTGHFPLERKSVEELLLREMRAEAAVGRVDWDIVLAADCAPHDSKDCNNLLRLVGRALPKVEEELLRAQKTLLLVYPGLLARYEALRVLERLRDAVGRRDGLFGVWLLIPSDDQQAMPVIDGKAVPIITPGQWARIPDPWLKNQHRQASRPGDDTSVPVGEVDG